MMLPTAWFVRHRAFTSSLSLSRTDDVDAFLVYHIMAFYTVNRSARRRVLVAAVDSVAGLRRVRDSEAR
jgi:hypothetical protein